MGRLVSSFLTLRVPFDITEVEGGGGSGENGQWINWSRRGVSATFGMCVGGERKGELPTFLPFISGDKKSQYFVHFNVIEREYM